MNIIIVLSIAYICASCWETILHGWILHANSDHRRLWRRLPKIWHNLLQYGWYSHHIVHHCLTFRQDHITQFSSKEEQNKVDNLLQKELDGYQRTGYGLSIYGFWEFFMFLIPLFTLPLFYIFGGLIETLVVIPILSSQMILSYFVHTWLHKSQAEVITKAPTWIRYLVRSRYGRFIVCHHYLHHHYPTYNFNLLWGGDWLLGVHLKPTQKDLIEINRLCLLSYMESN